MRADRLLSLLMLLQTRGRMTAEELAEALDVTPRTIYRDIDALCATGVPVYPEHGPGGGFALLDSYRTTLTGLNADELRALFMLSVPSPFEKLGISQELRSALLKLSAAQPAARRSRDEEMQNRFLIDWESFQSEAPAPHLQVIHAAVRQNRRLLLSYRLIMGTLIAEVPVEPYALVAKAGDWFLVGLRAGLMDVFRVADLSGVQATSETFARLPGFDLPAFWSAWCQRYEQRRQRYPVRLCFSPQVQPYLPLYFGHRAKTWVQQGEMDPASGWLTLTVEFESLEHARGALLNLGHAAEVLAPLALRKSIIDYAQTIWNFYQERE